MQPQIQVHLCSSGEIHFGPMDSAWNTLCYSGANMLSSVDMKILASAWRLERSIILHVGVRPAVFTTVEGAAAERMSASISSQLCWPRNAHSAARYGWPSRTMCNFLLQNDQRLSVQLWLALLARNPQEPFSPVPLLSGVTEPHDESLGHVPVAWDYPDLVISSRE
jgi:hypothetical protein